MFNNNNRAVIIRSVKKEISANGVMKNHVMNMERRVRIGNETLVRVRGVK